MADFNLQQAIGVGLGMATPIIIMMATNRRQAKKDIEKKHTENIAVQNEVAQLLRFHPPHTHGERAGALHAEGILFPPPPVPKKE